MAGQSAMPGRGRKPKPNNKKLLSGSRNAKENAVEFDLITNIDAPDWLDELGKGIWKTIVPHLCKEKVLAVTDLHNVEAFCSAYSTFRAAEIHISENGLVVEGATGGPMKNPACTVKNESLRQMTMYGAALGLDPASRGRLMGPIGGKAKGNDFEGF
jgi:P27 family predicted phage terminase small subunit